MWTAEQCLVGKQHTYLLSLFVRTWEFVGVNRVSGTLRSLYQCSLVRCFANGVQMDVCSVNTHQGLRLRDSECCTVSVWVWPPITSRRNEWCPVWASVSEQGGYLAFGKASKSGTVSAISSGWQKKGYRLSLPKNIKNVSQAKCHDPKRKLPQTRDCLQPRKHHGVRRTL